MRITVELPDELLKPLIERHLQDSRSVMSQVADAVSLYNKAYIEFMKGKCILAGTLSNNNSYVTDRVILLQAVGKGEVNE